MRLIILLTAVIASSSVLAQSNIKSFDIGSVTLSQTLASPNQCNGSDAAPIGYPGGTTNGNFYPAPTLGGGSFPTGPYTIVDTAITVMSNDLEVESYVGMLGPNGDGIISHNVGQGTFHSAPGVTFPNDNSLDNQIHIHISCGIFQHFGGSAPTWGGVPFAIIQWTVWYTQP
jgi:hypothetical protein